jgi:DNA-binding transcriptional ArsR family regulator
MRIRNAYTKSEEIMDEEIEFLATASDALAHPARIRMLRYIMEQNKTRTPVCNKDLVAAFGYAQATVSQHMKTLVKSGLVESMKKDKATYYFVNAGLVYKYVDTVKKL